MWHSETSLRPNTCWVALGIPKACSYKCTSSRKFKQDANPRTAFDNLRTLHGGCEGMCSSSLKSLQESPSSPPTKTHPSSPSGTFGGFGYGYRTGLSACLGRATTTMPGSVYTDESNTLAASSSSSDHLRAVTCTDLCSVTLTGYGVLLARIPGFVNGNRVTAFMVEPVAHYVTDTGHTFERQ